MGLLSEAPMITASFAPAPAINTESVATFAQKVQLCLLTNRNDTALKYKVNSGVAISATSFDGIVPAHETLDLSYGGKRSVLSVRIFPEAGPTANMIAVTGLPA